MPILERNFLQKP